MKFHCFILLFVRSDELRRLALALEWNEYESNDDFSTFSTPKKLSMISRKVVESLPRASKKSQRNGLVFALDDK
jgi:hypothetical protein